MSGCRLFITRGQRLATIGLAACSLNLVSGCGSSQPNAHGLSFTVDPNKLVLMGPGPDSSCVDKTNYKIAMATATNASAPPVLETSVSGPVLMFNNFTLTWNSPDTLYVQGVIVTLTGSGISGGSAQITLPQTEIDNLLANPDAVINPPLNPPPTTPNPSSTTISSTDPARNTASTPVSGYATCGLAIGPVPLANGTKTTSFQATAQITVIGTGQDSDGNQYFVEYQVNATASYFALPQ